MKRKNIVMVVMLLLIIGLMIFTVYKAANVGISGDMSGQSMSMQSDMAGEDNGNQPPEIPDGDNGNQSTDMEGGDNGNQPPEIPNGDNGNQPLEMPGGDNGNLYYIIFGIEALIFSILLMYLILSSFNRKNVKETFSTKDKVAIMVLSVIILTEIVTFAEKTVMDKLMPDNTVGGSMGFEMNNTQSISYQGSTEVTTDNEITSGEYDSTNVDENTILVSGENDVTLSDITVSKTGDSEGGDNTSFYGINSAILAKDGAALTIENITVSTDAIGANGVFSYGGSATTNNISSDGTTINISNSVITTSKDNSGGIMTTGGGILNANNLTVTTAGTSSAAIRTDRGGGTVNVDGGTYTTTGQGSPAVYSTADVSVKNSELVATNSEGIIIEGKNSVTINNCNLTDTNNKLNGLSTTYKNIFLYQSMSGDAADGLAEFTAIDSNITTNKGDTFYVTNTSASINLNNTIIKNNDSDGNFLRIQKDSWGNEGSNGGNVTLNTENQEMCGNIIVDSISTLEISLNSNSYYEGIINGENTAKSITLKLDASSNIRLMGDCYVTELDDESGDYSNIDFNGYKLYVNGVAIN